MRCSEPGGSVVVAIIASRAPVHTVGTSSAAQRSVLGNPEQPPIAQALNTVERILFSHKLITRPPSPKLLTTVRDSSHAPNG